MIRFGPSWCNEAHAPLQRAASWNPYFYRFFGSDHRQVRNGLQPISGDESCKALWRVVEASGGQHPRPATLRQCLSRMWYSGYRPRDQDHYTRFKKLARQAIPRAPEAQLISEEQDLEDALQTLLADSDDAPSRAIRAQSGLLADTPLEPPSARRDSKPVELTFDGNVWVIRKEFLVRGPFEGVTALLNPINWQHLAPFFKETRRVEPRQTATNPLEPWSGVLNEKIVVNWNTFAVQTFDVFLNIDYTVSHDDGVTRADYSLQYETNNQIVIDDGYAEARDQRDGTTRYIGYKRVRFSSSFLNLLAPAILCMQIEHDEGGFRDTVEREARAVAPVAQAAAKAARAQKKSTWQKRRAHGSRS